MLADPIHDEGLFTFAVGRPDFDRLYPEGDCGVVFFEHFEAVVCGLDCLEV